MEAFIMKVLLWHQSLAPGFTSARRLTSKQRGGQAQEMSGRNRLPDLQNNRFLAAQKPV